MTAWMLISTLFAAEPAKAPPAKVYVVYVTVVEIDAAGNETVLFTPKVQTTGNPAGATVEHVDGRTFEFNCKMAASTEPALERPPETSSTQKKPFQLTVGAKPKQSPASATPGPIRAAAKHSPTLPSPLVRSGGEGTKPIAPATAGEYFVRTYDVSTLLDIPADQPVTDANFTPVVQTIKAFTNATAWDGQATIKPFVSTKSLVIKQTAAGHDSVAEALSKLKSDK